MKNKKAAMEMTMGTMVTIVLLTMVLILGGYFISKVFSSGSNALDGISQSVENEINKLFTEDNSKKVVVYPTTRQVTIQKGSDNLGFGFSIRNVNNDEGTFSYEISAEEASCDMTLTKAEDLITLGKERTGIKLPAGSFMDDPIFVRFDIPETAPPCQIRYSITIYEGSASGALYGSPVDVDLIIESE